MEHYHTPVSAGNAFGLPFAAALTSGKPDDYRHELTPAGAVVFRRIRRSPSLCNLIATLAGLGSKEE